MRSGDGSSAWPVAHQTRWLRRWWLDRSVRTKGLIVIAVPLIAFVGTISANLVLQYNQHQARSVALATSNLTVAANLVLADAVNAETGVRGYAATGDPLFLGPYNLALSRLGAERASLRTAAVAEGDSGRQRVVNGTTGKVLVELARIRSVVGADVSGGGLRSRLGSGGNLRTALLNGKKTMDLLRGEVAGLTAGPAALLAPQLRTINRLETTTDLLARVSDDHGLVTPGGIQA